MTITKKHKKLLIPILILLSLLTVFAASKKVHAYTEKTVTVSKENVTVGEIEDDSPMTPKGNLTLVDDLVSKESSESRRFITVETRDGHWFYIIIDKNGNDDNVYFLNEVDNSDLYALTESENETKISCTCSEKCSAGNVKTDCPICKNNITDCEGKEELKEEGTDKENQENVKKEGSAKNITKILIIAVLALATGYVGYKLIKYFFKDDGISGSTELTMEALKRTGEMYKSESENNDQTIQTDSQIIVGEEEDNG